LGVGVLLFSPTGQCLKYVVQLAFHRESCARSTAECESLLAGLRIVEGLGVTHLAVWGDSQLTPGQAGRTYMSPLMKAYAGGMRKLEHCFSNLKLEHVPHRHDAITKELSQIAAKGLPVPAGILVERLSKPHQHQHWGIPRQPRHKKM
jgi:ribonuclease HI